MVAEGVRTIRFRCENMSYHDADHLARVVRRQGDRGMIVLDLKQTTHTTTAALARLTVLRRNLLMTGGDLHLQHLRGRTRNVYDIHRMAGLLPCEDETSYPTS